MLWTLGGIDSGFLGNSGCQSGDGWRVFSQPPRIDLTEMLTAVEIAACKDLG